MNCELSAPHPLDLQCLLNRLNEEEYPYVLSLCNKVNASVKDLQLHSTREATSIYAGLCSGLSEHISKYMRMRRLVLLPYFLDLLEKEDEGHDCRICSGRCSVQHMAHIAGIRKAHGTMKDLLLQIRTTGWTLYGTFDYPESYRVLRRNMLLLDNALEEILFIEESALIPMMIDLQQKIGVHG